MKSHRTCFGQSERRMKKWPSSLGADSSHIWTGAIRCDQETIVNSSCNLWACFAFASGLDHIQMGMFQLKRRLWRNFERDAPPIKVHARLKDASTLNLFCLRCITSLWRSAPS